MDCSVSTKRLVSSVYCDNLVSSFWFGMGYPTIFSLFLMLRLITFPFIIQRRSDKGYACLTSLDKENGVERKPLLDLIDSVFWQSFLMNFMKISGILIFALFGIRIPFKFIKCFFLIYRDYKRVNIVGVTMIQGIVKRFENIGIFFRLSQNVFSRFSKNTFLKDIFFRFSNSDLKIRDKLSFCLKNK